MRIHLIAVGEKMPAWVESGFQEYTRRLPSECQLKLVEIPAAFRGKNASVEKTKKEEGEKIGRAIPSGSFVIALDVLGKSWSTRELAQQMQRWMSDGRDVSLLVGGPEGLPEACIKRAEARWSLSALTFPHPLVRVILAEQLYRAWSILKNHPYHRE
jgi:23S rRNA (pseudouridine1915-N3)-methyltransferase